MSEKIRSLVRKQTIAYPGADGPKTFRRYDHATISALATVLAAGYFNDWRSTLQPGDVIDCVTGLPSAVDEAKLVVLTAPATGNVTVGHDQAPSGVRAVVPTADGSGTGKILPTDRFVEITSANADHIAELPPATASTRGREILIWVVASTNCELRTPASSNATINNVDSDGTQEALLTHSRFYKVTQHLDNGWLLEGLTALGAVATAVVPD